MTSPGGAGYLHMALVLRHVHQCTGSPPSRPCPGTHGIPVNHRAASQDYAGLAWVHYDLAFRRQAALTRLTRWSAINPTIYTLCFVGLAMTATSCELCFASTHTAKECAQQGDPDPGVKDHLKAIEKVVLSLAPGATRPYSHPLHGGGDGA